MVLVVVVPVNMAELVKNILGGLVVKSIRLVVFLEPKTYMELVTEAKTYQITARTDSELINKIIGKFLHEMPILTLQLEQIKQANAKKKVIIEELESKLNEIKTKTKQKSKK